jgi:hypothetical protein
MRTEGFNMDTKPKVKVVAVFETYLEGRLCRCEVDADANALQSRESRFAAETSARLAFSQLSQSWKAGQKIKCVDLVKVPVIETESPIIPTTFYDVAFTCDYCGNKWTEKYPAAIVHKTLSGCRRCLIGLTGPGEQIRYTGGRDIRGDDIATADKALRRGSVYVVAQAYKSENRQGIRIELEGIPGRFDFRLFTPAEFGR